ncbi:response regulator transcription factor [Ottowia testudinis]|uniref:Response regulator transcription factor n=1 Tax=Ottowia testudinis TaxID=2816950 RepID=A0A975H367_9BURK|nr:LuxR C-terminal-related transcriptional regulator [Ottowia testudinis]QTD45514.1 response regulator transcription factor [Ottowia testudinis]
MNSPALPVGPAGRTLYMLDDNAQFCATAKWWLSGAGYEVIDFQDAELALQALKGLDAGAIARACLLLDVRMPVLSGLQVHDELIKHGITGERARPSLPIIYMTGHGDVPLAVQAMEKGAVTFLEKPFQDSALESALARAFEPRPVPAPALAPGSAAAVISTLMTTDQAPCAEYHRRVGSLSPRELQVMQGVVEGKISKTIARELDISTKTVELHRSRVMAKMHADSVVHLTRMALAQRVL